jgi:uncharacterized protein (DUF433 family)
MSTSEAETDEVAVAMRAVSTTPDIMGGMAVFRGTRIPIDNILGSLDEGTTFACIQDAYPYLTEELIAAARIYARLFPQRPRARSIAEVHPDWKVISRKILRAAGHDDPPLLLVQQGTQRSFTSSRLDQSGTGNI